MADELAGLVRDDDDGDQVQEQLPAGWRNLFAAAGEKMGDWGFPFSHFGRGALKMAESRVAGDPEGARQGAIEMIRFVCMQLRIEPGEVFTD